jgi:hypothetical protein
MRNYSSFGLHELYDCSHVGRVGSLPSRGGEDNIRLGQEEGEVETRLGTVDEGRRAMKSLITFHLIGPRWVSALNFGILHTYVSTVNTNYVLLLCNLITLAPDLASLRGPLKQSE